MKKILYYLLTVPMLGLISCDSNKIPDVDIVATFDGGTQVDDLYYVVQGDELQVTGIHVVNDDIQASIGNVTYYWDYTPIGISTTAPYALNISTDEVSIGYHILTAEMPVYAVGYSISSGFMAKKIVVVADYDDIPTDSTPGDTNTHATLQEGDIR